jgi:phytoene synthase
MVDERLHHIFKRGSKTYFYSTMFFPRSIKGDVFKLYSFVRTADDHVDSFPQRLDLLQAMRSGLDQAMAGKQTGDVVVDSFAELCVRKDFDLAWVDAFVNSMTLDTYKDSYRTLEELDEYLYGSAEVIGLMMAKIMDLPEESYHGARRLGRAMQFINFIRDVQEDCELGRSYFPSEEMEQFGLTSLSEKEVRAQPAAFMALVRKQINRYQVWQAEAEASFRYIPRKYLLPIKTASDMYKFTARRIAADPFVVYHRKVKPSIGRIVSGYLLNFMTVAPRL